MSPPRRSDIYVLVLSYNHRVCPEGFYIALVSTSVETNQPEDEVTPGIQLLGNSVLEKFYSVDDLYEPVEYAHQDNIFISRSYDATTHFESTMDDVFEIYEKVEKEILCLFYVILLNLKSRSSVNLWMYFI